MSPCYQVFVVYASLFNIQIYSFNNANIPCCPNLFSSWVWIMKTWIQGTSILKLLMLGPSVVTPFPLWPNANTWTGSVWHSLLFSLSCLSVLDGSSFPFVSFIISLLSYPALSSVLPRKESEGVHLRDGSRGHSSHRANMCASLEAL